MMQVMGELFLEAGLVIWMMITVVWVYSLVIRDASVMDVFWGPGFIVVSALFVLGVEGMSAREAVVLALVALWGLRLAIHIGLRNQGQSEDSRYAEWRRNGGTSWWWKSYFKVFLLQGVVMWLVSLTLLYPLAGPYPVDLTLLDWMGLSVWIFGFLFEVVGDYQLNRFKRNPENHGKLFTGGLWSLTRHPNYFGESVLWWGFALFALAAGGWPGLLGPLLMTFLLLKVSGVTLLEQTMSGSKPGLEEYRKSVPAFVPWKLISGWWRFSLFLLIAVPCVLLAGLQYKYGAPPDLSRGILVEKVDLDRFAGDWYVVAGKTTFLERDAVNSVETYRISSDGKILIDYTFRKFSPDGFSVVMSGKGIPQPGTGNAYWTVRFTGPLKFSYQVVDLAADYRYAVVVSASGHVWILSRTPELKASDKDSILKRLAGLGYDPGAIRDIPQQWNNSHRSVTLSWRSLA